MFSQTLAALLIGATAVAGAAGITHNHQETIEHHRGAIDARYQSRVTIAHRQVGAVTPGGVSSTLRCAWRADVVVDRDARSVAGVAASRSIAQDGVLKGSHPGWCSGARPAIARAVAAREARLRDHLMATVESDRAAVLADIDRLHGTAARG